MGTVVGTVVGTECMVLHAGSSLHRIRIVCLLSGMRLARGQTHLAGTDGRG